MNDAELRHQDEVDKRDRKHEADGKRLKDSFMPTTAPWTERFTFSGAHGPFTMLLTSLFDDV